MLTDKELKEIKPFLDEDGRVTAFPAKKRKYLTVVLYVYERIPMGEYDTKGINEAIDKWHTFRDAATFRRDMCDLGLMSRDKFGYKYEKTDKDVELGSLLTLF